MKSLAILAILSFSGFAQAETVFRIDVGSNYESYSNQDLRRRVWELERAVQQLQMKVFELELGKPSLPPAVETWVCKISAMGDTFTGTGGSKAVAIHNVTEACKKGRNGDGFFCKDPKCEQ